MDTPPYRSTPVSFARRGGRLRERQQRAWDELADRYLLDLPRLASNTSVDPDFHFDQEAAFGRLAPLIVEIGSGRGEVIVRAAWDNPDIDFLAIEVYIPGIAQTLLSMRQQQPSNLKIALLNAAEALDTMLAAGSVQELWLFFPDPWHKLRHHKRRLVTPDFAAKAARVLKPGGVWRLATDWQDYADQMHAVLAQTPLFDFSNDWAPRFDGRIMTRFERKGIAAGREIRDLQAIRRKQTRMTT